MTTEEDIQKQLNEDILAWHKKVYDGDLPENFIEMFRKSLMHIPPALHKISTDVCKKIASRKEGEVEFIEVGIMINMVYSTPFEKIYSSLDEALKITGQFDLIRDEYNRKSAEFEQKCFKKRARLMNLAGITKSVPFKSPIIAEA